MKFVYPLLLFICAPLLLTGQNLTALVVDESNEPILGAYVINPSIDYHTHTNDLGQCLLNESSVGDTLKIMHLGYETTEFIVDRNSGQIKIALVESFFDLGEVVVGQNSKKVNIIAAIDINTSPVSSSQEFLRKVPGLFIGQHAGGGKAEQIFLRGFDIDHGTDVAISVDGMPVNMVSHAHGQGYADMHFVIPETVEEIDFGKGPYYADKGNFTTAGYVGFKTKDKLENSQITVEAGRFNTLRTAGMLKLLDTEKHDIYLASEYMFSDGPFESSQNFVRNNFMLKYAGELPDRSRISILASNFYSKWDASGQVPQRAIDRGDITRFGAIDDTEGGQTGRTNIALSYDRPINDNTFIKNNVYYSLYDFELYSNFTFFLEDPVNGDQIRQKEDRQIFGLESVLNHATSLNKADVLFKLGIGLRSDQVNGNELSSTLNRRTTLLTHQLGDVDEKNLYAFADVSFDVGDWLFQPSVRFDYFKFNYIDDLLNVYDNQGQSKSIVSPKFTTVYNMNDNVQLYFNTGVGFHSNDARVIIDNEAESILPAAYGADLGAFIKPAPRLFTNVALWWLSLEQEFVYVGDAGIVEPSGSTRRLGVDFSLRYQLNNWLFANGDFNYAFARSKDTENDFIPLAPRITSSGGLNFSKKKVSAGINFRYIQDRPANEDNSIVAEGYLVTDLSASYNFKKVTLGFAIENLLNTEWNEAQFATESRLQFEPNSVEEIHFTPGSPFFIKGIMKYHF